MSFSVASARSKIQDIVPAGVVTKLSNSAVNWLSEQSPESVDLLWKNLQSANDENNFNDGIMAEFLENVIQDMKKDISKLRSEISEIRVESFKRGLENQELILRLKMQSKENEDFILQLKMQSKENKELKDENKKLKDDLNELKLSVQQLQNVNQNMIAKSDPSQ